MACNCGGNRTLTDYQITYRGGGTETVTHEEGGLVKVRQLLAKSSQGGTYKATPRKT